MFTTQHYRAIAEVISAEHDGITPNSIPNPEARDIAHMSVKLLTYSLAAAFKADNPLFNFDLFISAAGTDKERA